MTRIHVYKERDRGLVKRSKGDYRRMNRGKLARDACGTVPVDVYGDSDESTIEGRHKVRIKELQPDSETTTSDLAMVCADCHRVINSRKSCLTIQVVRDVIAAHIP